MEPFVAHAGRAVPLRRSNVDTDQIIPAEYLKRVTRSGFEDGLFNSWRADPAFVLNDPAYAGADSLRLLERVVTLVKAAGYRIGSVDASVIAQAPRLAPHLAGMRDRLARSLGIERDAVSVKATTNDGLGIVGAGEAIATLATAIVEKFEP